MAKFSKGKKKTGGRKKGTANKVTENQSRVNRILAHIDENFLIEDIDNLSSSERVKTYVSLMEYVMPKLARREHTGANNEPFKILLVDASKTGDSTED